ncbi:amidohydrolase family protein [Stenotrophomonas pictorum]|uniref:amidohydrolase family protein n=1 Tax=Stenotrophomonas pictorum TaxID=86184 RepID=UPI000AF3D081|nr:amidohydrolase family protein [Stenotrophomonas pictorum]
MLDATVNRTTRSGYVLGPDQRVTPMEALKSLTIWAAEQYAEQDSKGSIETGKRADLVVLSDNPLTIAPAELHSIKVLQTIKDGEVVYDAASATASQSASCADNPECSRRLADTGFGHHH